MHANDFFRAAEFGCFDSVLRAHRKGVANWEDGETKGKFLGDEIHVEGERGVTGVVEGSLVRFYHEASGIPAVGAIG